MGSRAAFFSLLGAGAVAAACSHRGGIGANGSYQQAGSIMCAPVNVDERDPDYEEVLRRLEPAGYILYSPSRSPAAFLETTARIRAEHKNRPFIAIDQEGGSVQRVGGPIHLPSQMAVGATGSAFLAHEFGRCIGQTVRDVGGDVVFSPVLDLWSPGSFLGTRCLSDDPKTVARLADQIAQGISDAGVTPVLKHYPGYVGVHDPDIAAARDVIAKDALVRSGKIYSAVLRDARYPVIVANVHHRENGKDVPGSMSTAVIGSLKRIYGDVTLFSDALDMGVVQSYASPQGAGSAALRAGIHCLVFSQASALTQAASALANDLETGRIAPGVFGEARRHVGALRIRPCGRAGGTRVGIPSILAQIARSSVTLLERAWRPHPFRSIEIVYPAEIGHAPSLRTLESACSRYGAVVLRPLDRRGPLGEQHDCSVRIVYLNETLNDTWLERAAHIAVGERTAVIASGAPAPSLTHFPAPVILTYGIEDAQLYAAVDVLLGSRVASGVLPVKLPVK
jgi:beta-N-acetylhexosaminidase